MITKEEIDKEIDKVLEGLLKLHHMKREIEDEPESKETVELFEGKMWQHLFRWELTAYEWWENRVFHAETIRKICRN